jgi:hypothetical protein
VLRAPEEVFNKLLRPAERTGRHGHVAGDAAPATWFATEHETIRPAIEQLSAAADSLDLLPPAEALAKAREAHD